MPVPVRTGIRILDLRPRTPGGDRGGHRIRPEVRQRDEDDAGPLGIIGAGAVCGGLLYLVFSTSILSAGLIQAAIVSSGLVLVLVSLLK
ncbi:hypothetical protein [Natrononativus amylolyticus]|uniref:hypothetical protein n=1 Tax=Natrononativus amylolyticus TaxID=2963434 RepID=UPI0020CC0FF2|nr:hypothetical protein [Natrononativus amylolyticus]